jgi:hypothetical protein
MSAEYELDLEHPMLIQFIELLADILVAPANPKKDPGSGAAADPATSLTSDGQANGRGRNADRDNLVPGTVQ